MLRNYLLVAFRSFTRNVSFSIILVLGLAIGISASLVIYMLVRFENSFDKFEADADRICRVVIDLRFNGVAGHSAAVPAPAADAVQQEINGIDATVPVMQFQGDATVDVSTTRNGKEVTFKGQPDVIFTNDQYFELLPFQWLVGNPQTSLSDPFSVVLTESRAKLYFPGIPISDIPGKELEYQDDLRLFVTGIVRDLDERTDFTAREFISYATIEKTHLQDNFMMNVWNDWMAYSKLYLKLSSGANAGDVESQLNVMLRKYNANAAKDENNSIVFRLQPLSDIHFNTMYTSFGQRTASKEVLYGLLAIAAFLLGLACINFINLTTAQASQRAREIGIRKTIGSSKRQLVLQFLTETFLTTVMATILAVSIAPLLLQLFNDFLPPGLDFNVAKEPSVVLFICGLTVLVSFIAGFYPALILSGYQPAIVLKNHAAIAAPTRSASVRKLLTVSQFVIAQFFVIASVMVGKQIYFMLNQDLGFRKEAILTFETPFDSIASRRDHILNEIASFPEVQVVSKGFLPPAMQGAAFTNISYNDTKINVQLRFGDANYLDVYKIQLVAGRNVRDGQNVDEVLINEAYARELGFLQPADPLGKELTFGNGDKVTIVGVMRDFHEGSFHQPIGPIVFQSRANGRIFHVALHPQTGDGGQWQKAIQKIQHAVTEVYPDMDFKYSFFDDNLLQLYTREINTSRLLNWATGLSILISCLGLLGLVMYTAATRTKEIGIRKIMGASVTAVVSLLSIQFIRLVIIAFIIAAPVAWWAVDQWLNEFAYRTSMSWWVFAASGLLLVVAAMITLAIQTIKTARANPAEVLKNE